MYCSCKFNKLKLVTLFIWQLHIHPYNSCIYSTTVHHQLRPLEQGCQLPTLLWPPSYMPETHLRYITCLDQVSNALCVRKVVGDKHKPVSVSKCYTLVSCATQSWNIVWEVVSGMAQTELRNLMCLGTMQSPVYTSTSI